MNDADELELDSLDFTQWKSKIACNNEKLEVTIPRNVLFKYLAHIESFLDHQSLSHEDLTFLHSQLDQLITFILDTYSDIKEAHILSVNICRQLAKTYTLSLSQMMKSAHEHFNLSLIDTVHKFNELILANIKKLSMKSNWFTSIKYLSVIMLQSLFTSFNGFFNSYKQPLLTALYKHLSKCNDGYNSAVETGLFKANYFTDIVFLIDIILSHDNSSKVLDDKLFGRLIKMTKFLTEKNKASLNSSIYAYPNLTVMHSFNIVISLLKSDRYIASITAKKASNGSHIYLSSVQSYLSQIISAMETDHKKLRLSLSKNLCDLLVFTYIVFGTNIEDSDVALENCLNLLFLEITKVSTSSTIQMGLIETFIQWVSELNLYYQTKSISSSKTNLNGNSFLAEKFFNIMHIIYFHYFGAGSLESAKKLLKDDHFVTVNNQMNMNLSIKMSNQLNIIYQFLIDELDNDVNKLIVLCKLILGDSSGDHDYVKVLSLKVVVPSKILDLPNMWYAISLLNFAQFLIDDLGEYVLSRQDNISSSHEDVATQLADKLLGYCLNKNYRFRVTAVETLIKIVKIKPELSFEILNNSMNSLSETFEMNESSLNDDVNSNSHNNENQIKANIFNENHGNAFLLSNLLSFGSKDFITNDFVLSTFSIAFNFLKKFNSRVLSTNLFGSGSGFYIDNSNYEKQLISWILLIGLFNYNTNNSNLRSIENNFFLNDSAQFMSFWKNILAHSLPNGFVQIDKKSNKITNISEIIKLVEIKNHSLVGLITYFTYLSSTKDRFESKESKSLLTPEIIRNINQILVKSYSFLNNLSTEINNLNVSTPLEMSLNMNRLRIYEAYLKLLPHLNVRNEVNSTMLLEIVKNFSDIDLFRYSNDSLKKQNSKTNKKKQKSLAVSEYDIYSIDDEYIYGVTSKFNGFKIDELLIKDHIKQSSTLILNDIDLANFHNLFKIEKREIQSHKSNILIFDETTESRLKRTFANSFVNDPMIFLFNANDNFGYSDGIKYPPGLKTMIIDVSIEIFAIAFPYLSTKVQQSVIENIRSSIFYKAKESIDLIDDENKINFDESLYLRKKSIAINCSVAIHSIVSFMSNFNNEKIYESKLTFKDEIFNLLFETLRNINIEDSFLSYLNSESLGMCCSLVDNRQSELLSNNISILLNSIVENETSNSRAFDLKSLSNIIKYCNINNTPNINNALFTLLLDPHPVVHAAALDGLNIWIESNLSNLSNDEDKLVEILNLLKNIWLEDSFGNFSATTIASNMNNREHLNSSILLIKVLRSIVNSVGPMIKSWSLELKGMFRDLITSIYTLSTIDFEIIIREVLKLSDELLVFDKSMVFVNNYKMLIKSIIVNNLRLGVYKHSIFTIPLNDEYELENTIELYPNTNSKILLRMALESAYQLVKLCSNDNIKIIDENFEKLIWICLENDSQNKSISKIIEIIMDDSMSKLTNDRFLWFEKLVSYFSISKNQLLEELMLIYKKRINYGGMFFNINSISKDKKKSKSLAAIAISGSTANSGGNSSRRSTSQPINEDELSEAQETLTAITSESHGKNKKLKERRNADDEEEDDEEDARGMASYTPIESTINILDLENEQINWKFKLFLISMLNKLLDYCVEDNQLKIHLSKKISDFVRVTFVSSTSNLVTLRIESLKLLGKIIQLYGNMKDPLYEDVSILDQQQAQMISAITPAFSKDSTVELAGEAIILSSKLISSNITSLNKMTRIVKILTNSLEMLAILNNSIIKLNDYNGNGNNNLNDEDNDEIVKIGEIPIITKKSQNKIKMYLLQAWARMLILNNIYQSKELNNLLIQYSDILVPLWIFITKEFVMMKYGYFENNENNEGLTLEMYENGCWIDFIEALGITIENKEFKNSLGELLNEDDLGKLFMIIFSECVEYLFKRIGKTPVVVNSTDLSILATLKRIMKLEISNKILFNDSIFNEFIDLLNKIILVCNGESSDEILMEIDQILNVIFVEYFNQLKTGKCSEDDDDDDDVDQAADKADKFQHDFEKLFEFFRLIIKIITKKLPFIKDQKIDIDKVCDIQLTGSDMILIKKCFNSIIEMCEFLPNAIKIDLYNDLLFMFTLIYEFDNEKLISVLLPIFQKLITNFYLVDSDNINLINIYQIMKIKGNYKEKINDQLLTFIIVKSIPKLIVSELSIKTISEMIVSGIESSDSNLISLSVQTVKALINNIDDKGKTENENEDEHREHEFNISLNLMHLLLPQLAEILITGKSIQEPRLIIEIFIILIKKFASGSHSDRLAKSYSLVIPIIVIFEEKYQYLNYSHLKMIELVTINAKIFKEFINSCDEELKGKIEYIVKRETIQEEREGAVNNDSHIELKLLV